MKHLGIYTVVFILLVVSVQAQDIYSCLSLVSTVYTSFVRGGKFLRNIVYGAGTLSRLYTALDTFLKNDSKDPINNKDDTTSYVGDDSLFDSPMKEPEVKKIEQIDLLQVLPDNENEIAYPEQLEDNSGLDIEPTSFDLCKMDDIGDINCISDSSNAKQTKTVSSSSHEEIVFEGCGGVGFRLEDSKLPIRQMSNCCKEHSNCYSASCQSKKRRCDRDLRRCLLRLCRRKSRKTKPLEKLCRATIQLLHMSTMFNSSEQFKEAQQQLRCHRGKSNRHNNRRR